MVDMKKLEQDETNMSLKDLITLHGTLVELRKTVNDKELKVRKQIAKIAAPDPVEGANKFENETHAITVTHKLNRSLPRDESLIHDVLRKLGPEHADVLKTNWELVVGPYKALGPKARRIVDEIVITKDGTPEIKIKLK